MKVSLRRPHDPRHMVGTCDASAHRMDCEDTLRKLALVGALDVHERRALASAAEIYSLERGGRCWSEGRPSDEFSWVVRGRVKLVKLSECGRETIVETVAPCEMLCASAPCGFATYCCTSVAMESGTEVLTLRRADVLRVIERGSPAVTGMLRALASRGKNLCSRIEVLSSGQVTQRIAKLLLRLADRVGVERSGHGTWVPIALSRQDIADMCGTTIETSIRVMSRLAQQGIVKTQSRGFMIVSPSALEAAVRGSSRSANLA